MVERGKGQDLNLRPKAKVEISTLDQSSPSTNTRPIRPTQGIRPTHGLLRPTHGLLRPTHGGLNLRPTRGLPSTNARPVSTNARLPSTNAWPPSTNARLPSTNARSRPQPLTTADPRVETFTEIPSSTGPVASSQRESAAGPVVSSQRFPAAAASASSMTYGRGLNPRPCLFKFCLAPSSSHYFFFKLLAFHLSSEPFLPHPSHSSHISSSNSSHYLLFLPLSPLPNSSEHSLFCTNSHKFSTFSKFSPSFFPK